MIKWKTAWLRIYRAAVFVGVVLLMHRVASPDLVNVDVEVLREFFPNAAGVSDQGVKGARYVLNDPGKDLGYVLTTSPDSDGIVGYSGPNNVLVAFGLDGKVLGISVLSSGDTPEHLELATGDDSFMATFDGMEWEEIQSMQRVDGVSGATLTSLAIAEGVIRRVAGNAPSLRFPGSLELDDAQRLFPRAVTLETNGDVFGASGDVLGRIYRSSPQSDNLIGYGGPSDVLVGVGTDEKIIGIVIRKSYDTEKYVGYVRDEASFMQMFEGKTLQEVAEFGEVEGVSGATMTSQAVARAVAKVSANLSGVDGGSVSTIGVREIGTALVVLFGLLMAFTKLRGVRGIRVIFQLMLILYLGLVNGDLISQALLVGWAQNGLAWKFAPGMLLLVAAALLVPLLSRKQLYCHQLCPHGAAQQLLKNVLPRRFRIGIPRRVAIFLRAVPFLLLLLVVVVGVRQLAFNLVSIEPFDAYLFRRQVHCHPTI